MQALKRVTPTPEQLPIISRNRSGIEIIRGAAGSGKTTTALLRLRSLIGSSISRRNRLDDKAPVRVLVLTYNRTLKGYISALINDEIKLLKNVDIQVDTFGHWSYLAMGEPRMAPNASVTDLLRKLGSELPFSQEFLVDEIDYILGRFRPSEIENYVTATRVGRGRSPRVDANIRRLILDDVLYPYKDWKADNGYADWNDLAVDLAGAEGIPGFDIVVADETQDFSANQIRALLAHLEPTHNVTFVLDAAQRIYARGFTWSEVGILSPTVHKLNKNYRNTVEIAALAAGVIKGLAIEDDGTIPDLRSCSRHGDRPQVLKGTFAQQADHAIEKLRHIDLTAESAAFLHPKGGGWFGYLKKRLGESGLNYAEITRESEWPAGDENIALSTLSSAKGLEFDHVLILGLNAEIMSHGDEADDDRLGMYRRLVAMGMGRARQTVTLGYKAGEASKLIEFLDPTTFDEVVL